MKIAKRPFKVVLFAVIGAWVIWGIVGLFVAVDPSVLLGALGAIVVCVVGNVVCVVGNKIWTLLREERKGT